MIKEKLEAYLLEIKKRFVSTANIVYSHSKYRYEIEISLEYLKEAKKFDDLELTSGRKGYERFHTKEIKKLVDVLENKEE